MLGKRLTKPRRYISIYDPALYEAKPIDAAKYRVTRNIEDLGDFSAWPAQPTVFTIRPLEAGYGHLADAMSFMARRQLFMLHVDKVDGWDESIGVLEWEKHPDGHSLVSDCLVFFGDEVIDDVATFIVEAAQSDTTPFTLPESYRHYLKGTQNLRAMTAHLAASAKETSSD